MIKILLFICVIWMFLSFCPYESIAALCSLSILFVSTLFPHCTSIFGLISWSVLLPYFIRFWLWIHANKLMCPKDRNTLCFSSISHCKWKWDEQFWKVLQLRKSLLLWFFVLCLIFIFFQLETFWLSYEWFEQVLPLNFSF